MFSNNTRTLLPIILGSVFTTLFAICGLSVNVSAQNTPDYLLGNLTLERNLTSEQRQEVIEKVSNYISTMKKEANGNITKLNVLLIEDLAKRNIIDEEAKQGLLSFIAAIPKPLLPGLRGTMPENLSTSGNTTGLFGSLEDSSKLLENIARNNSDSQPVTLMTDILKKRISDLGIVPTGPVTISSESTWANVGKVATCSLVGSILPGGAGWGAAAACANLVA
jgi:hypothetical protein